MLCITDQAGNAVFTNQSVIPAQAGIQRAGVR